MRQRAAEVLFRHKFLLALPFLIILPLSGALMLQPQAPSWQTSARIWVEQDPTIYSDPQLGYAPAPNQVRLLNDFLRSRSFELAVLQQTRLAPALQTQRGTDQALKLFQGSVSATAVDNYFVNIVVTMPDRDLSYETLQGIISQYQSTLQSQKQALGDEAVKLYGTSLQQTQDALTKAQNDVAAYLASHPDLATYSTTLSLPVTTRDPNLALLMQQLANVQSTYDNLRDHYFKVQTADVLSGTFGPFAFKVIDAPQRPAEPLRASRLELLKLPAIGFVLASLLSAGIGALLVLSNRSVLADFDVEDALGLPLLGELPDLPSRDRPWKRPVPDIVRLRLSGPARTVRPGSNGQSA